jgi:hypothetical protein
VKKASNIRLDMPDDEWRMYDRCPEEQLQHCFVYEIARECEEMKRQLEWLRERLATTPQWTANDLLTEFPGQSLSEYPTRLLFTTEGKFLTACLRYFPQTPWLGTPETFRAKLARAFWTTKDRCTGENSFTKWGDPPLLIVSLAAGPLSKTDQRIFRYALAIDWTQSNKRLTERFRLWLERNEPPSRSVEEQRGRTSPREMLKALAAFRLMKNHTSEDAATFTQGKLKKPLYSDASNWSKQRKTGARLVSEFGG